ncbi:hypothetical protein Tco_1379156, partial [Tanacetum coccineum]
MGLTLSFSRVTPTPRGPGPANEHAGPRDLSRPPLTTTSKLRFLLRFCERASPPQLAQILTLSGNRVARKVEIKLKEKARNKTPSIAKHIDPNMQQYKGLLSIGMDIAKIARKRSKPDKHGHGNRRAHKETGVSTKRGNSNWQRGLVIRGLSQDMAQGNVIKGFH